MGREVTIVMYHYVREIANSSYPKIKGLEYSDFKKQIKYFKKNYQIIRMEDFIDVFQKTKNLLPEKALLLTFDDGYIDHYRYVYPYLMEQGVQGSFFMPAQILDEGCVLDVNKIHFVLATRKVEDLVSELFTYIKKLRAEGMELEPPEKLFERFALANRWDNKETIFVKRLLQKELPKKVRGAIVQELFEQSVGIAEQEFSEELYLSMEQIRQMKADGMYFGNHGYGHYHLGSLSERQAEEDIKKGLDWFAERGIFNPKEWVMNFPYGSFTEKTLLIAEKLGAQIGISVKPEIVNVDIHNRLSLPRFDTNDFYPKKRL